MLQWMDIADKAEALWPGDLFGTVGYPEYDAMADAMAGQQKRQLSARHCLDAI